MPGVSNRSTVCTCFATDRYYQVGAQIQSSLSSWSLDIAGIHMSAILVSDSSCWLLQSVPRIKGLTSFSMVSHITIDFVSDGRWPLHSFPSFHASRKRFRCWLTFSFSCMVTWPMCSGFGRNYANRSKNLMPTVSRAEHAHSLLPITATDTSSFESSDTGPRKYGCPTRTCLSCLLQCQVTFILIYCTL